ncbi:hypothetical protein B0H14DRAFT_2819024 [Mycena olivaceomarginata]|nr:hypothetical protein B0H14DRAFT_2819024 [Mycena olivaceomarginata]
MEEQKKKRKTHANRCRMRRRGEKFLQILDLEDLDTLPPSPSRAQPLHLRSQINGIIWAARHGNVTAHPCLASRQHEGGSQPVWRRAGAGGESEVGARRGTCLNPLMPTGSTPRRLSPHSSQCWVRARAAKPSARWQMFCVCPMMASLQAMVARPRCLPRKSGVLAASTSCFTRASRT